MRLTNLEARAARKRQSLKIGGRTRTDGTDGADWTHVDGLHGRDGTTHDCRKDECREVTKEDVLSFGMQLTPFGKVRFRCQIANIV